MEGSKPASSTTSTVADFSSSPSGSKSSASSSSLMAELFGKPASSQTAPSAGGIFDFFYSDPTSRGVSKENFASDGQAWKSEQSEYMTLDQMRTSPDGYFPHTERDGQVMTNKNLSYHSNEVVEPTLLTSSIHYGGREDYIKPSTAEKYSKRNNIVERSQEDISDGGSPRGNFWRGSFYY